MALLLVLLPTLGVLTLSGTLLCIRCGCAMQLRADVVRRVGRLKSRYSGVQAAGGGGGGGGGGAAPGGASLLELFRGFVRDGGGLMRAALHNKKPLTRQGLRHTEYPTATRSWSIGENH